MEISKILKAESIALKLDVKDKDHAIDLLIDLANKSGLITDREEVLKEVWIREKIMSTGVGNQIALPHAKTNAVKDSVASFITIKSELDFDSLDEKPVKLAFLLLGRDNNVGNHLRLLGRISKIMNNEALKSRLLEFDEPDEVINLFKELEDID